MSMRTFTKSVLVIMAFAVATRLIGFVFRIFLSRLLGAEMLGIYQMALSVFMILLTVISSGLPLVISREVAKHPRHTSYVKRLTTAGLLIGLIASIILAAGVILGQDLWARIFADRRALNILLALLPGLIASSVYCVLRAVWWGEKRFVLLGLTELLEQIARVLLFVLFLGATAYFQDLAQLSAWAFSGACIVSATIVVVIFFKTAQFIKSPPPHQPYIRPLLKSATPITAVRLLAGIAMPVITVLLPLRLVACGWTQINAVAHLGIIMGMTMPLLTIPATVISAIATVLVPELSTMQAQAQNTRVQNQVATVIKFTIFINFLFIPLYWALGEPLGNFLYQDAISGQYLARAAWIMLPMSLSQITNTTLNSLHRENDAIRNYVVGTVLLLIIVWCLPAVLGADAVLLGWGVSTTVSSVLNINSLRRATAWHPQTQTMALIITYTAVSVPVWALGHCGYQLCGLPLWLNLGLWGGVMCAAWVGLTWATNLFIFPKRGHN